MPDLRTELTEIVTGLGMTGAPSVADAFDALLPAMENVPAAVWERVRGAHAAGEHADLVAAAWENGRAFAESPEALRRRRPRWIQWKGPVRPPGYDTLPADLRVDHVYLVSCKYGSKILRNASPAQLLDHRLAGGTAVADWYAAVAPDAYDEFSAAVRREVDLPVAVGARPSVMTEDERGVVRDRCGRAWPASLRQPWIDCSEVIARESAGRWNAALDTPAKREEMVWRLLRLETSPYFVLGRSLDRTPLRYRVMTPWDWRDSFRFLDLRVRGRVGRGQPEVDWCAVAEERATGEVREVRGHVEVRWSHGRFSAVEAKIYLDTPAHAVAGYVPL